MTSRRPVLVDEDVRLVYTPTVDPDEMMVTGGTGSGVVAVVGWIRVATLRH